jgi:polar amino acid transport system substrate-binding protein
MALLAVFPVLLLTACSNTSSSSSTSSSSGGGQATTSVLNQVLSRGVLRVAIIVPAPGYATVASNGQYVGYEADIANLLATDLGVKIDFIQTDNTGRVTLVQTGKADVAIATFSQTFQRMDVINFTNPIDIGVQVLVTSAGNALTKVSQFNKSGMRIAVATGGTQVQTVSTQLPNATEVQFPSPDDAIQAVLSGQADAAATGYSTVGQYEAANPGKLQLVSGTLGTPVYNGIGLVQGDFTWWNYLNYFVNTINQNGTTCTLWQKYFGAGTTPGTFAVCPS